MSIFSHLMQEVAKGYSFSVDFEKRNLKIDGKFIIENGKFDSSQNLINNTYKTNEEIIQVIEILYEQYKYSIPEERSDNKRKKYFFAYQMEDITDEKLFNNLESREIARARLEGFILCEIINGTFKWNDSWGNWFWQSKNDKDLIILKNWII